LVWVSLSFLASPLRSQICETESTVPLFPHYTYFFFVKVDLPTGVGPSTLVWSTARCPFTLIFAPEAPPLALSRFPFFRSGFFQYSSQELAHFFVKASLGEWTKSQTPPLSFFLFLLCRFFDRGLVRFPYSSPAFFEPFSHLG